MADFRIYIPNSGELTQLLFEPSTGILYSTYTDGTTRSTSIIGDEDNESKTIYVNDTVLSPYTGTLEQKIAQYINNLNYDKVDLYSDIIIEYDNT